MRIFKDKTVQTKAPHKCMLCEQTIPVGLARYQVTLIQEGHHLDRYWMHVQCWKDAV